MLYSNIGEQKGEGGQYFNNYLMRKKKVLYCNMVLPFEVRGEGMRAHAVAVVAAVAGGGGGGGGGGGARGSGEGRRLKSTLNELHRIGTSIFLLKILYLL